MTAGLFSRVGETREVEGLLLPFGELSRPGNLTNTEPVMFSASSVTLPRDPSVVTLNEEHNRYAPLGRATSLTITDGGVVAKFAIANTDEGDAYLASSSKRKLSAELGSIFRRGDQAVSSRLTGAAVCEDGAFASAALFSLPPGEEVMLASDTPASDEYVSPDRDNSSTTVTEFTDSEGVRWRRTEEYSSTSTVTKVTNDTDAETPAEDKPATEGALMGNIVPGGAATTTPRRSLDGLFAAVASKDPDAIKEYEDAGAAFALATLQHSGPGAATIAADVQESGYLGELWLRAPYQRRFIPLVTQKTLTNWRMQAWRWITLPEVGDYAGNTAEVPSNAVDTEPVEVTANRLAGGERIDRRYEDFNDQAVIASFVEKQTDDYKRKTDGKLLTALVAASTVTAPGAVPAGVAKGLAAIVDGALGVISSENRPGFAIVAADLWRDIALMKTNDKLAFLNAGFGLESGDVDSFKIVPAPVGAGPGQIGAGRVYVGAKEAMQYFELGEAPIRVEGVVPGNGAKDLAVFGYWATLAVNGQAIRSVQTVN